MVSRKFNWTSSSSLSNQNQLNELNYKMIEYYTVFETRDKYQQMIDINHSDITNPGIITLGFLDYVKQLGKESLLEIGCGAGRIYQFLSKYLDKFNYTGVEISENIIKKNISKFPNTNWVVAGAYHIPVPDESVDICFSFYVLEHLVFPEKALIEMLRTLKKGGYLILVFPDFAASGRLASQSIGLNSGATALSKLKKGKLIDAIVSLYDSRIRLPNALKNAVMKIGDFPVNLSPKCLSEKNGTVSPDIDAVYIASKIEIENWSKKRGLQVCYPEGKNDQFNEHAFLSIIKV